MRHRGAPRAEHAFRGRDPRRRALLGAALVVGTLAAACGGGAPPRLEVTRARAPGGAPAAGAAEAGERPLPGAPSAVSGHGVAGAGVTAQFTLRNAGGRALLLHGLQPACGCRLASALPDALTPGGATVLTLVCRTPTTGGAITRESRLISNDPVRGEQTLPVAIATPPSAAEPATLHFGYVRVGSSATRVVLVDADTEGLRAAAEPVAGAPELEIEALGPRADGRRGYRVRFSPRTAGVWRSQLELAGGRSALAASGVGFASVLVFPFEVTVPHEATAGGLPALAIKGIGEAPLAITGVELPPGLVGELSTLSPGRDYRLALRVRGSGRAASGVIRLHTDAPDQPEVTIPVRAADHRPGSGPGVPVNPP